MNDGRSIYDGSDIFQRNDRNSGHLNSKVKDFLGEMVRKEFQEDVRRKETRREPQDLREILRNL